MFSTLSASAVLGQRELIRFLRQRNRVIGSFVTPIVFWVFIGFGMGHSYASPNASVGAAAHGVQQVGYTAYFFPGAVMLSLLFTAIFSTISVIEDRREGFLQGVLVAPVGRVAIVGGKVLGGAILATGQALLFLLLGWASGVVHLTGISFLAAMAVMFISSVGLTALGLFIAWPMTSTQGFHVVMNIFLMPMWMLSGALFPIRDDTPRLFKLVMLANPLTYALASLRGVLSRGEPMWRHWLGRLPVTVGVTSAAAVVMVGLTVWIAQSRTNADTV